jgi:hypothetical protein
VSERQHILRWGGTSGILAAVILTAMIAIGLVSGPGTTELMQPTDRELVLDQLPTNSTSVQIITILDDLFVLAYTGAFLGLAALVWSESRWLAGVATIFALATALLDFTENAHLLAMTQGIGGEANLTDSALRALALLTQVKYSCSHLATFLFGLAMIKRDRLSWAVTILLFLYPVASSVAFAYEPAAMVRLLLMWLLLALGGWLARREGAAMAPQARTPDPLSAESGSDAVSP